MQLHRLITIVSIMMPTLAFAQNGTADVGSIAASLITSLRNTNRERVFLQTDKRIYEQGETVWFKAFIVDSVNNKPTYKNRVLYVDLVDSKDSVVSLLLLHADRDGINGSFNLNDSSLQGYYWLRAYTEKIIAENSNNVGLQPVYVVNNKIRNGSNNEKINKTSLTDVSRPFVDVYPEGGWLISGANSLLAVKVHDVHGNPIVASGLVKDNRDTVVAKFRTNDHGLAKFGFSPSWFGKYKIYLLNGDRYDSVGMLPAVNPYAAQLSVEEQNEQSIKVRVMLEDSVYSPDYTTYILGISKDSLCFAGIGTGMYELNIPVSNFPAGMAKLLLFNAKKEYVSERNIYVHRKNVVVSLNMDKQNYWARDNAKLDIAVTDESGKPLVATLSVSVIDAQIAGPAANDTIERMEALSTDDADLFMLTTEPDAPTWINREKEMHMSPANADDVLRITGTVINKKKEPMPGQQVMLMSNSETVFILQDTTDDKGRFSFQMPDFDDGAQFSVQINDLSGHKTEGKAVLDAFHSPHFTTPSAMKDKFFSEGLKSGVETRHYDSMIMNAEKGWLVPVTANAEKSKKNNHKEDDIITREMLRAGGVNNIATAILQTGKFHLLNGFLMEGGSNGFAPSALDEPAVIMDGLQVALSAPNPPEISPVLSFLRSVPADQVDYIRVLSGTSAGIYGVRSGHGIIEIHTTTTLTDYSTGNALNIIHPRGFHVPLAFPVPDYKKKDPKNAKDPDFRRTIYWNGNLVTDKDGKASVNFYTADIPTSYIVTVTGITANGHNIHKFITISRK